MQEEKDVSFVQDPKTWYQQATLVNQIIIIMILVILESTESGATRAKVFYGSTSSLRAV